MVVRKGVILAAGYGTRFLPATKALPKEMLPLLDRPVIQYVVEEAVAAGINLIIVVTAAGKESVEGYFDRDLKLEQVLEVAGDTDHLEEVRRLSRIADMAFVRQKERLGNGHAVLQVRSLIGDEPFAVFFPDDVIFAERPAIGQLMEVHDRYGGAVIAVQEVPREEVVHYGVIAPEPLEESVYQVMGIVEKPTVEMAPSNLIQIGRFVFTPEIFEVLEETPPGRDGEIWLTDAIALLLRRQPVYACRFRGERFDTGQPIGFLKACLAAALRRADMGPELEEYLRGLDLESL